MSVFNPSLSFEQQQRVYDAYISAAFNNGPSYYEQNRINNHIEAQYVNTYFSSFEQNSRNSSSSLKSPTSSYWSSTGIF